MDVLQETDLKDYLFRIRDLEMLCYEQEQYINYLNNLVRRLQRPALYRKTTYGKEGTFSRPFSIGMTTTALLCAIGGAICCPLFNQDQISWFFDVIAGAIIGALTLGLIGLVIGIAVGIICGLIGVLIERKHKRAINIENQKIDIQNSQILANAERQIDLVNIEISKAISLHNETKKVLDEYYDKNIIYKKYHDLVPITMFCEYFVSGRCNTLTGHEGAYNIYENEVRQNIIIAKLDNIISQLESIKQNQYMIADMIQESNKEIHLLSKGVEQQINVLQNIEENTSINNYYGKINAINTSYLSWLAHRHYQM